jgi:predicted dehydrogenase
VTTAGAAGAVPLRWAIVGPGRIAHRFAQAVQGLPQARLVAVLGRNAERAHDFAQCWQAPGRSAVHVAPDLATLLARADVDAVYVATPHSHHADAVAAALQAGKHVLCEKPLVPHSAAALPLVALSQSQGVFLMEALWTRFLPVYGTVQQWLQQGAIGTLRSVHSSFCFHAPYDPENRVFNPALAGGALLDIGIYNLSLLRWVLQATRGHCPEPQRWQLQGLLAPTGVDRRVAALLAFEGELTASFECSLDSHSANALRIEGSTGHILLPHNFWQATQAELHVHGQPAQTVHAPFAINGFEGEIEEATRCIRAGLTQSPRMPHSETLATLRWMDHIRAELGVRYPFE